MSGAQIDKNLKKLEKAAGQTLGDSKNPTPRFHPLGGPGLDAGNDGHHPQPGVEREDSRGPHRQTGNPRFAYDCYRRFIQMYGDDRLGAQARPEGGRRLRFEKIIEEKKAERGLTADMDLTAGDLKDLCVRFKAAILKNTGLEFPEDPRERALGRDRGGLRFLDERPGHRLPEDVRHPRGLGHGRQRPGSLVFGNMGPTPGRAWPSPATRRPGRTSSTGNT